MISTVPLSLQSARSLDKSDALRNYRKQFYIPVIKGKKALYFCGNSLGLQPKNTKAALLQELKDWQELGVEGHFEGKNPWYSYHHLLSRPLSLIVGAQAQEVIAMNTLTVNLHLMMASFYRPTPQRYKIIFEGRAFSSDRYALQSQAQLHGFSADAALIELFPREGEHCLRHSDIIAAIEEAGETLALVMMGGVNYYTGQVFDLAAITAAAHRNGAMAGFDLAHAVGNVPLQLHDWKVDFAVWCGYKYLNSGPGGAAGAFVHERHGNNTALPRLAGWWGFDEEKRFQMPHDFVPQRGAAGWQLSNAQILPLAAHKAALEIFEAVGMQALREKSLRLTGFLEQLLEALNARHEAFDLITPKNEAERGCQLSLLMRHRGKAIFNYITERGVIADWREPNVLRVAPVPLYNTFEEVWHFSRLLEEALEKLY